MKKWKIRYYKMLIRVLVFLAGRRFKGLKDYSQSKVGGNETAQAGETIVYILRKEK